MVPRPSDHPPEYDNPDREAEDLTEEELFLERATAYWLNEMTVEERQVFEEQMRSDASFREEAESWRIILAAVRAWLAAPAPGQEGATRRRESRDNANGKADDFITKTASLMI